MAITFILFSCGGDAIRLFPQPTDRCRDAESPDELLCGTGFIPVPALAGYTNRIVCVAKYEMKNSDGKAVSQAAGTPWSIINRNDAIEKCQALGSQYDLITNDEWQAVARDAILVGQNWSDGDSSADVSSHTLPLGHSDGSPNKALAASANDDQPCLGTNTSGECVGDFDLQARTHTLSNGEVIWDLAGNLSEWVKDDNNIIYGPNNYISLVVRTNPDPSRAYTIRGRLSIDGVSGRKRNAHDQFGPAADYSSCTNFGGGLGFGNLTYDPNDTDLPQGGAVVRGGNWSDSNGGIAIKQSGIFTTKLDFTTNLPSTQIGFRCSCHP